VDPTLHAYPAAQLPEHWSDVTPDVLPNRPAGHCPLHAAVVMPDTAPYCPALQLVQLLAPTRLYVPAGHAAGVADTDPATQ